MISIETASIEYNLSTDSTMLKFSGEIEVHGYPAHLTDTNNEENMLIIVRELVKQIKIISALTSDK